MFVLFQGRDQRQPNITWIKRHRCISLFGIFQRRFTPTANALAKVRQFRQFLFHLRRGHHVLKRRLGHHGCHVVVATVRTGFTDKHFHHGPFDLNFNGGFQHASAIHQDKHTTQQLCQHALRHFNVAVVTGGLTTVGVVLIFQSLFFDFHFIIGSHLIIIFVVTIDGVFGVLLPSVFVFFLSDPTVFHKHGTMFLYRRQRSFQVKFVFWFFQQFLRQFDFFSFFRPSIAIRLRIR